MNPDPLKGQSSSAGTPTFVVISVFLGLFQLFTMALTGFLLLRYILFQIHVYVWNLYNIFIIQAKCTKFDL